jgi:hypothetical protein
MIPVDGTWLWWLEVVAVIWLLLVCLGTIWLANRDRVSFWHDEDDSGF